MPTVQSYYAPTTRKVYDTTLTVAQASLTIPVPAGGKNLRIYAQAKSVGAFTSDQFYARFNGDATATNYNTQYIVATGTTLTAAEIIGTAQAALIGTICAANSPAAEFGSCELFVANYQATAFNRPWQSRSIALLTLLSGGMNLGQFGGYWFVATPVSQVTLFAGSGTNLAIGSAVQVYVDY